MKTRNRLANCDHSLMVSFAFLGGASLAEHGFEITPKSQLSEPQAVSGIWGSKDCGNIAVKHLISTIPRWSELLALGLRLSVKKCWGSDFDRGQSASV